jgi:hypothetical protein
VILRFLRLFPQFRALEAERDSAESRLVAENRAVARVIELETRDESRLLQMAAARDERDEAIRERDELRAALQEENQRALLLQDRLDAMQETVSRLWGMTESAQNRAYRAMEMQVNYATQQKFGVTPYPDASHLPPSAEADLDSDHVVRRRMAPSELIANQTRKLRDDVLERLNKKTA